MLYRSFALVTCFALFNMSVPYGAVVTLGIPLKDGVMEAFKVHGPKSVAPPKSRPLSAKEQRTISGRQSQPAQGQCPYLAGQNKWDVTYDGIDLMSGNYAASVTDLSFDGGYGIPVNVTRSYSSNDGGEEPFGMGWSLSADVRNTAGGVLKSPAAPIRSVPNNFKERPTTEADPNVATQPAAAVTSTDASGRDETIQKDIDGILTTPPWDNNISNPTYAFVTLNGATYQVQTGNTTTTLDGTVYTYTAEGSYPSGTVPYNNPSATPQAANILKVTSVADRQGNVTTYTYNQNVWVYFSKIDGITKEHPLTSVSMPNGHTITFTWGTGALTNRIVSITDGTRTVQYAYQSYAMSGYPAINGNPAGYIYMLSSVTTPGGKTTGYTYTNARAVNNYSGVVAQNLLYTITDPRGLVTKMSYAMDNQNVNPYEVSVPAPICERVIQPNGVEFYFCANSDGLFDGDWPANFGSSNNPFLANEAFQLWAGSASNSGTMLYSSVISEGVNGANEFVVSLGSGAYLAQTGVAGFSTSYYDPHSENLLEYDSQVLPYGGGVGDLSASRNLQASDASSGFRWVDESTTYNFAGNPLSKIDSEYLYQNRSQVMTRQATVSYADWDSTKYYQQKATKDRGGRYSYTDYYTNTAAAGSRGQQYEVFDNAHAGFYQNMYITPPNYALQPDYWKYQLTPTAGQYTGQFVYDSVGRCTSVSKLQSTTTNPWTYVVTQTTYGGNGSPTWGQATQVVEDVGGINRTTSTLAYTAWGKPSKVQDAAGHQFSTSYDLDDNVQTVTRVDSGLNQSIVSYVYGSTPPNGGINVTYGQPTSVTDGVSGVTDSITYQSSGGGVGQISEVIESGGPDASYSVIYTYTPAGDRWQVSYTTNKGTNYWEYDDYEYLGPIYNLQHGFQTLTQLNSSMQLTWEQIQYAYDSVGTLRACAFAQSPAVGYTPPSGSPWYNSSNQASYRARTYYAYDPGGRVLSVQNWWDTWTSNGFTSEAVLDNECAYEYSGLNRGLKTQSNFLMNTARGSSNWTAVNSETFSYDPSLDYLTGANYGDGLPNATPTWSYDAAGNRTDSVCDNLNRTTAIGGVSTTCDILGNRLTQGSSSFSYDCLNRMTSNSTGYNYTYRADGMRIDKHNPTTTNGVAFRYDGENTFEDYAYAGANATQINDYGLGARGVNYIARTSSNVTTVGFPIYDAHGNMTACLFRTNSTNPPANTYYSLANQREYDAWGTIRNGATTGDPRGRYCANLGHKQDDETLFVYMRSRYYDPYSGRFVTEDPSRSGQNLFSYCNGDPVNLVDRDGQFPQIIAAFLIGFLAGAIAEFITQLATSPKDFMDAIESINWGKVLFAGLAGGVTGALLAGGGFGLVALGKSMGSTLIGDIGQAFLGLATACSAKTLAGVLTGGAVGGLALSVLSLEAHNLQIMMLLDDND